MQRDPHIEHSPLHVQWDMLAQSVRITSNLLYIPLRSHKRSRSKSTNLSSSGIVDISESRGESRKFVTHILAMKLLLKNHLERKVVSVRELFYRDVSSFRNRQNILKEAIVNVASMHDMSISEDFGVYPSSKGLVYGGPSIQLQGERDCKILHLDYSYREQLIPYISGNLHVDNEPSTVVLFEKDSVFKSYCDHFKRYKVDEKKSYLFMTAKGFPDDASIGLLYSIAQSCKELSIHAFMDSDVYGICIFWTYRRALKQFADKIHFKGVYLLDYQSGWVTVNRRDLSLTMSLLKRVSFEPSRLSGKQVGTLMKVKQELTRGLLLFKKAEMNAIGTNSADNHDLLSYVDSKMGLS